MLEVHRYIDIIRHSTALRTKKDAVVDRKIENSTRFRAEAGE
jgi:hypothetical protein